MAQTGVKPGGGSPVQRGGPGGGESSPGRAGVWPRKKVLPSSEGFGPEGWGLHSDDDTCMTP